MREQTIYLDTHRAARLLGLSAKTLSRYRVSGGGPVFHKFGTLIRYRREDLEAWTATRRRASTSDDGTALLGADRRGRR
ncbi:MAG: helix-turn-helix domain-containing protein [Boseongicola sp. SB0662_bin_57]|nr:helix-turn-helix domain-containing protein [Boseongicola sp. SB0662_bin_57]